jgi:hypothetical protein
MLAGNSSRAIAELGCIEATACGALAQAVAAAGEGGGGRGVRGWGGGVMGDRLCVCVWGGGLRGEGLWGGG